MRWEERPYLATRLVYCYCSSQSFRVLINVACPTYIHIIIIWANSCQKLTKSEIGSSWSRFKHCSEWLVQPIGSHMWSLYMPMHVKSWPKVKMYQAEVGSNIAQKCENFIKSEIYSNIAQNHFHISQFDLWRSSKVRGHPVQKSWGQLKDHIHVYDFLCVSSKFWSWHAPFRRYSPL